MQSKTYAFSLNKIVVVGLVLFLLGGLSHYGLQYLYGLKSDASSPCKTAQKALDNFTGALQDEGTDYDDLVASGDSVSLDTLSSLMLNVYSACGSVNLASAPAQKLSIMP